MLTTVVHCDNPQHKQHLKAFLTQYLTVNKNAEFVIIKVNPDDWAIDLENPKKNTDVPQGTPHSFVGSDVRRPGQRGQGVRLPVGPAHGMCPSCEQTRRAGVFGHPLLFPRRRRRNPIRGHHQHRVLARRARFAHLANQHHRSEERIHHEFKHHRYRDVHAGDVMR